MLRFRDEVTVPCPRARAFLAVADLSRVQEWDPAVRRSQALPPAVLGPGARFQVDLDVLGRTLPIVHEICEWVDGERLVIDTQGPAMHGQLVVRLAGDADACRVDYEARTCLTGAWRLAEPLLGTAFGRTRARALEGLRRWLAVQPTVGTAVSDPVGEPLGAR